MNRATIGTLKLHNLENLIEAQLLAELQGYRDTEEYQMFQQLIGSKQTVRGNVGRQARVNMLKKFVSFLVKKGFRRLGQGAFGAVFEHPSLDYAIKIFRNDPAYLSFMDFVANNRSNPYLPKFRGRFMKLDDQNYVVRMEKLKRIGNWYTPVSVAGRCRSPESADQWINRCRQIADYKTPLFNKGENLDDLRAGREVAVQRQIAIRNRIGDRNWGEMGTDTRSELRSANHQEYEAHKIVDPIERYLNGEDKEVDFTIKNELFCTTIGEISQIATGSMKLDLHSGNFMKRGSIPVISDPIADMSFI